MPERPRSVKMCAVPLLYPMHGPSVLEPAAVRSTLELLSQPFVFSQAHLLSESQFAAEAKKRGLSLDRGELEQFHRRGVLVPFYQVHARSVAQGEDRYPTRQVAGTEWQVYRASVVGCLSDPASRPFRRWPRSRAGMYYSQYQLLGLRSLPLVMTKMKARREADGVIWDLDPLAPRERAWHAQSRALAIALEALSPRYRPRVVGVLRSREGELAHLIDDHDPAAEAEFLALDNELVLRQAEVLLSTARSFDPLGTWSRVTRIANPRRWDELRNDALVAQEHRVAAELLLQFLEDQADQGRAPQVEPVSIKWHEPRHERLGAGQRERAETILDFNLSDRPALYLALEGKTELTIVPKVLDLVGFGALSPWITLVDLEGVGGDVNLLARAVAVPRLDPDGYRGARIISPLAALLVVVDPEGRRYGTDAARDKTLIGMIDHVLKSLPPILRTDAMRRDLEFLIHLRTWDEEFEFAHFSDSELAAAIRAQVLPGCPCEADIRTALANARASRTPIKSVWKDWPMRPSKPALAEALWPRLERRITNPRARRAVPVLDIVQEAVRISHVVRQPREIAVEE